MVALDQVERRLGVKTVRTNSEGHLALVAWAAQFDGLDEVGVPFALEDCRHLTRRLESDPIDAEAVALAALRNPDLPVAELDGPARGQTALGPPPRPGRAEDPDRSPGPLAPARARPGRQQRRRERGPAGCGVLSAALIVGATAGVHRFRDKDAYARFTGTAPVPVWSGSSKGKVQLNRGGNRSTNYALHMIAVTQARGVGPGRAYLDKQTGRGQDRVAGLRLLRRRLSDVGFTALRANSQLAAQEPRTEMPDAA